MKKSPVLDEALIGAAQNVERYEIAAYGTARATAECSVRRQATDERLSEIAVATMTGDEMEEEADEEAEEEPEEEEITSE
jgi:ferritin-like metal-binding protein YciE